MLQSARSARLMVRRAVLLAGAAGLVALQSAAPVAALVQSPRAQPAVTASAKGSSVRVTGPRMYDPKTKSLFSSPSTVTVSQTTDLVNQEIQVSWTNFTPSRGTPYIPFGTEYPVMVAECAGDSPGNSPSDISRCFFGNGQFGLQEANSKFGQTTEVYTTTAANGTGAANIQIETSIQNQDLGCDVHHDCSLLILPADGGVPGQPGLTPANCSNHRLDSSWATGAATYNPPNSQAGYDSCAWNYRIVVPLHFAETPASCRFSQADFSVEGSPFMERGMSSWQSALCHGSSPLDVAYSGQVSEPQARSDFLSGVTDVALTTEPGSGPGKHPYTYAPVGISAAVFGYWLDSTKTDLPYPSGVKLDPRLMAKALTQSYTYNFACYPANSGKTQPIIPDGCDPHVMGDRQDILSDPEFKALNPQLKSLFFSGFPRMVPTVTGDASDMTWEVTRWIAANPEATQFLAGQFDPWGEHVNTSYLRTQYPAQTFQTSDPNGTAFYSFNPVQPADRVSFYLSQNQGYSFNWTLQPTNIPCGQKGQPACAYPVQQPAFPGQRTVAAITDNADAAAFLFPVAALENHAGKYVTPTAASMAAAVSGMTTSANGITKDANEASRNPGAYPLTMVSYAMVPTGGLSHEKAVKISRWLDFVAGRGQVQGAIPGELPPGYLPLPASMRRQTLKAAFEVLHQTGGHGGNAGHHGGGPGGSGGPGGGGSGSISGTGSSSGAGSAGNGAGSSGGKGSSPGTTTHGTVSAAFSNPDTQGFARLIVPILLALGALLALAGPSTVVLSRPGGRAALARGWQRVRTPLRNLPFGWGRKS